MSWGKNNSRSRRIAGWQAKRNGEYFEEKFRQRCEEDGYYALRIPDGCRQVGAHKLIRVKSPFDWVVNCGTTHLFCDTKSYDSKSLPYSKLDQNQIEKLYQVKRLTPSQAGYVVYFRPINEVILFDVFQLKGLKPGKSLLPVEGFKLGDSEDFSLANCI